MKSDSIVIIPTYNEKENIEQIITAIFALSAQPETAHFQPHILIIDDA